MAHTRTRATRRRALAREGLVYRQPRAIRYPHGSHLPRICTQRHNIYAQHRILRDSRLSYRHSRRYLGSPWFGPTNEALKCLKLAAVNPGTTLTLSTSSAYVLFHRRSDAFSFSFAHAAINSQSPSHTVLYQTPGSSPAVLQSPVMSNAR